MQNLQTSFSVRHKQIVRLLFFMLMEQFHITDKTVIFIAIQFSVETSYTVLTAF